jgi:hypothetical protein
MPKAAARLDRLFDFRTVVLTCGQVPQFIERFNQERNCQLRAPLDELVDDAWIFDLDGRDAAIRERATQIAAFIAFVHRTVWQPYLEWFSRLEPRPDPARAPRCDRSPS